MTAAALPTLAPLADAASLLWTADQIITGLAILVAVATLIRWVRRGRDPLASAYCRPNHLREDAVLLAVCTYLLIAAAMAGLMQLLTGNSDGINARLITGNSAQLAGIAACLLIAERFFDGGLHRFVVGPNGAPTHRVLSFALTAFVGIGLCPLVAEATLRTIHYLVPAQPIAPHPTLEALRGGPLPVPIRVALWVSAVVVAPVAEEVFFRGILQTFLVRIVGTRWRAIALAAVAFGLVHVSQVHTVVALALLGMLLGFAYERTGSILVPIGIHAVFNLKTLLWDQWGGYRG